MGGNANVALPLQQLQRGKAGGPASPASTGCSSFSSHGQGRLTGGCQGWGFPSLLLDPASVITLPHIHGHCDSQIIILLFIFMEQNNCSGIKLLLLLHGPYGGSYTPRAPSYSGLVLPVCVP